MINILAHFSSAIFIYIYILVIPVRGLVVGSSRDGVSGDQLTTSRCPQWVNADNVQGLSVKGLLGPTHQEGGGTAFSAVTLDRREDSSSVHESRKPSPSLTEVESHLVGWAGGGGNVPWASKRSPLDFFPFLLSSCYL